MSPRQFFLTLVFGTLGGLAATVSFNFVVDPFWYFRKVELAGFNAVKPKFVNFERHVKPALVAREQPEAIIFGSSFAEIGFDPLNHNFTDGGRLSGYNFGIAGATWREVQCYIEYALARARPQRILVGISLGAMPRVDCGKQIADMTSPDLVSFLLSTDALKASISTVWEQRKGAGSHTREGLFYYAKAAPEVDSRFREFFRTHEQVCPIDDLAAQHAKTLTLPLPPPAKAVDFSGLTHVLELAAEQRIDVFLVVYPVHTYIDELGYLCGTYRNTWAMVSKLGQLVARMPRRASVRVELWDFPDYNSLTGERVTSDVMRYWQDPRHFNSELGDIVLAQIFGAQEASLPQFGYRVVPGAEATQFERVTRERQAYVAKHAWFLRDLERLLVEAGVTHAKGAGS
jgi:hypothetical protein